MNIDGKIEGIKYKPLLLCNLNEIDIDAFDINSIQSTSLLKDAHHTFAISKWISPKRTRSYPFERVYDTLSFTKRIAIIPIVKDEGINGDRDYIQWDTVSLMSLLDVFVIFAYYDKAQKHKTLNGKITNQQFNNEYIISKIKEIEQYFSSALHWNLNELKTNFYKIAKIAANAYNIIEQTTSVKLHDAKGLKKFVRKIKKESTEFVKFSRDKAKNAQNREFMTIQPKESLSTSTKAKITIKNYLGGEYFLTVDEIFSKNNIIYLTEKKHSKNLLMPSISDIKDGLLKMILYSNLTEVTIDGKKATSKPVLHLTSTKLKEEITSAEAKNNIDIFLRINNFSDLQIGIIEKIFKEAKQNNFIVKIGFSK
jgi:hypothetical protein